MSLEFYKYLHIIGLSLFLIALSSWYTLAITKNLEKHVKIKKRMAMLNGIAMLIILISGFGQAAKLELFSNLPVWLWIKIVLWLFLAIAIPIMMRKAKSASVVLYSALIAVLIVVYFGLFKL